MPTKSLFCEIRLFICYILRGGTIYIKKYILRFIKFKK